MGKNKTPEQEKWGRLSLNILAQKKQLCTKLIKFNLFSWIIYKTKISDSSDFSHFEYLYVYMCFVFSLSADPKAFMIERLERLQKSKTSKRDYPCLFDESNVQSVYGMLDPTNRGYVTLKQYSEGMFWLCSKLCHFSVFQEIYGIVCLSESYCMSER